jgi:hypothetical protein
VLKLLANLVHEPMSGRANGVVNNMAYGIVNGKDQSIVISKDLAKSFQYVWQKSVCRSYRDVHCLFILVVPAYDFLAISYLISNLILCLAKISVSKFQK